MSQNNLASIRRSCVGVKVGSVTIGGHAPVVVQSMTNTDTADETATTEQVAQLARAGSELVRITVNSPDAAKSVAGIRERLDAMGCHVPLVGDFHFNGHKLLTAYPDCAQALAKFRINPGNVGKGKKRDEQFATLIETACKYMTNRFVSASTGAAWIRKCSRASWMKTLNPVNRRMHRS